MKKSYFSLTFILSAVMLLTACASSQYEEIDLTKQVPVEKYEQYIRLNDSLFGVADGPIAPGVYDGRVGKKIGTVSKVGTQILQNDEVASTGKEGLPVLQAGDEIHQIEGTSSKVEVLIQTEEGYVSASFLSYLDKK